MPAAICLSLTSPADDGLPIPPVAIPALVRTAASAGGFTPPGWRIEAARTGDVDRDGRADLIAVLKGADPGCVIASGRGADPLDTNPRLLIVATGTARGYALRLANPRIVPRLEDPYMDDPFENGGLEVARGAIRVTLGNWRSAGGWGTSRTTLTFRWDGRGFPLIGFDRQSLQRNSGATETVSIDFATGRATFATGSIEDDADTKVRRRCVPRRAVPRLETIGDGLEYEPPR